MCLIFGYNKVVSSPQVCYFISFTCGCITVSMTISPACGLRRLVLRWACLVCLRRGRRPRRRSGGGDVTFPHPLAASLIINHESQSLILSQSHSIIPTSLSSFVGQTRCLGALFNWVAINPISDEGLETRIHYTHYSFTILSICVKYGQIVSYTFSFSPVQYCVYLRHPSINCIVLQSPAITKMIKPASDI